MTTHPNYPNYPTKALLSTQSATLAQQSHSPQPAQYHIIVNRQQHRQLNPNNIATSHAGSLNSESLKGAKFTHSIGYAVQNPDLHLNYLQAAQGNFIPAPPERFMVSSGSSSNQPPQPQLPAYKGGYIETAQTAQPLYQSIKRTYVPHHIYNQIPLQNTRSRQYNQSQEEMMEQGLDDADQKMLQQYQKLYLSYMEQRSRNQHLQRQLGQYESKKDSEPAEVREKIVAREVLVDRPKKIDTKLLASLILRKNESVIGQIVSRRKNTCVSRLRGLLGEEELAIRTEISRTTDEFTLKQVRTK